MAQHGTTAAANQEEIKRLKKDKASLSMQRALALLETETITDRMNAMQATLCEKRRHNQKSSFWEDKINSVEARTTNQEIPISKRSGQKLNTRIPGGLARKRAQAAEQKIDN